MDWESGVPVLFTAIDPHEFPKRMIEGGAQIVNGIAKDQTACWFGAKIDSDGDETAIRLELKPSSIRVSLQGPLQIEDVMLGPINL
jgi:hypothetical protein